MGQKASRRSLPPAEEVEEAPYELRSIRAPRLTGWIFRLAVELLDSPIAGPLWDINFRRSGIPQAVRELDMPEPATFQPVWPLPAALDKDEILVEGHPVAERLMVASNGVPGFKAGEERRKTGGKLDRRWTISDFAQAYAAGTTTPSEVAERVLRCVEDSERADPPMRFLIACNAADLRRNAAESTQRYKQGRPLSVLDGVPYTIIDGIDALPYPTTAGTSFLHRYRQATADAPCIAELRAAGALLIGKANLHEVGMGMTGLNTVHGTTRNPYNVACYTGGSSSGAAAAVSAGLCAFSLGIDGGGSVRVPSALCGVFGLRPTVGRTSTAHCPENAFSIMSFGSHTVSIADAALVYAVISNAGRQGAAAGPAPTTVPAQLFDDTPAAAELLMPLKGRRVGVYWRLFEDAQPEVVAACRHALGLLEEHGCEVVPICVPDLEQVRVAQILTISSEIAQAYKWATADRALKRQLNRETRFSLMAAARFSATDYLQAQKIRTRIMTHYRRIFFQQGIDYVATPTTGATAPVIDPMALTEGESDLTQTGELMRFTISANMAGIPALSIPVGQSSSGMPIGLQLMGRPWCEASLLYAGSVLESAVRPLIKMPGVSYDLL
ncbi:g6145 [Coccomyxa elongata]